MTKYCVSSRWLVNRKIYFKWNYTSTCNRLKYPNGLLGLIILVFLLGSTVTVNGQITENFECTENGCCDHHEFCQFWDSFGECNNNRAWMASNCQLSCNMCNRGPIEPQGNQPPSQRPDPAPGEQSNFAQPPSVPLPDQKQEDQFGQGQNQNQDSQPEQQQQDKLADRQGKTLSFQGAGPRKEFQGNNALRCEEILRQNPNNIIEMMIQEGLLSEHEDVTFRRIVTLDDILQSNRFTGCAPQQSQTDCSRNTCYNLRYRTMDGTCNNLQRPLLGAAATPFMRLRRANFDDGVAAPTGSMRGGRPSARETTKFILRSPEIVNSNRFNVLLMQFGQFVTHDITKTSVIPHDQCPPCQDMGGRCFPIRVFPGDNHAACQQQPFGSCCLNFARSAPICGTGTNPNNIRLLMNENSAYLDGSMIYSNSVPDNFRLRDGPFMRAAMINGRQFLPFDQQQCSDPSSCKADFKAGDDRVTIFIGLTAFHTLMIREHNRVASILRQSNQQWNDDRVFHEARKILGAELQAITYKEWLPKILGSAFTNITGKYNGYDPRVDPSIASEFTHGAMRFGHGMIPEFFNRLDPTGRSIPAGGIRFDEGILKPQRLLFEGGIDPLIRGMMAMPVKRPQRIANIVTERMFGNNDLASINLQRGRDAGVPSYNEMREFCGLKKARTFDDVSGEILDVNIRRNLQKGFGTPDNLDLYVGALLEDPISDGMVGPTGSCVIADQFKRVRDGDRFWYQNPSVFTKNQLQELEQVTMARLICDNADNIGMVPKEAFIMHGGNLVPCATIPQMDLRHWNE